MSSSIVNRKKKPSHSRCSQCQVLAALVLEQKQTISELKATVKKLEGRVATLSEEVTSLSGENHALKQTIQSLEDKLKRHSQNSNQPPSSDGDEKPAPKSQRKKTGRRPGGQPGHPGHRLEPVSEADHIVIHEVHVCSQCGKCLEHVEVIGHVCRQVFDIPPPSLEVVEHRAQEKLCADCHVITTAAFPKDIKQPTQYGPSIKALSTYFHQVHFIPFERLQAVLSEVFGVSVSQGSLVNFNYGCSNKLSVFQKTIKEHLLKAQVVGFDESGMRLHGKNHWLHVAQTKDATFYSLHEKRGILGMNAGGILPKFQGMAMHDHWGSYYRYQDCDHSLCNAHHLRELEFAATRYGHRWAKKLQSFLCEANKLVETHKQKGLSALSKEQLKKQEAKYSRILNGGSDEIAALPQYPPSQRGKQKQHKVKNLWDRLKAYKLDTLRFLRNFDVPFTNNDSERDIRMCKVKAKISGSFRSQRGAEAFTKMRSYLSTAKKNQMNGLDAILDAFHGTPYLPS